MNAFLFSKNENGFLCLAIDSIVNVKLNECIIICLIDVPNTGPNLTSPNETSFIEHSRSTRSVFI